MSMIGTYWTIEYINSNMKIDETHILCVDSINGSVLHVSCYFHALQMTNSRNTLESTIKREGRAATEAEIVAFNQAYQTPAI